MLKCSIKHLETFAKMTYNRTCRGYLKRAKPQLKGLRVLIYALIESQMGYNDSISQVSNIRFSIQCLAQNTTSRYQQVSIYIRYDARQDAPSKTQVCM